MGLLAHARDCARAVHAVFHGLRLGYYIVAIEHIGPGHPDAAELARRALASQIIVNDFLAARDA